MLEKVCITFNNCSEKFQYSLLVSNDNKEHFPQISPAPVNNIVLVDHHSLFGSEIYRNINFTKSQVNIPVNFTSKETMIIDPLAYKLPRPRTSGAVFSGLGFLVCFGSTLQYSPSPSPLPMEMEMESNEETQETLGLKIQLQMSAIEYDKNDKRNHVESVQIDDGSDAKSVRDSNLFSQESNLEKNDYKHMRTYADLLLKLKEENLTTSTQFNVISIFKI